MAVKRLSILLATILISTNLAYGYTLDGSNYIEIPSTDSLKLTTFNIEIEFMLSNIPDQRMYLVSKGSSDNGNKGLDQNYAVFITRSGKIGAGFKDVDNNYHYIYTDDPISINELHKVKVVYNGYKLKLIVDGGEIIYPTKTTPDTSDKPLLIGANSNVRDNYFKGEIERLVIRDHSQWKIVYSLDGSDNNDNNRCDRMPLSEFVGVVFVDEILAEKRSSPEADYVSKSLGYLASQGFTGLRVPFYWESYDARPTEFINELKKIAEIAEQNGLCIIWDNHHYYTTSVWKVEEDGRGFPAWAVKDYPSPSDGKYSTVAKKFWSDLLDNKIQINGKSLWDHQVDFLEIVIDTVDDYESTKGLELLNEPHLWDDTQYAKLGEYNTYLAKELRKVTDMTLVIKRENMKSGGRDPDLEYLIIPKGISNIAYSPHLYSVPCNGCQGEVQLQRFNAWAKEWNVQVYIGEFSAKTQSDADTFLQKFKSYGFGWTEWRWTEVKGSGLGGDGRGVKIGLLDDGRPNEALEYLLRAYDKYY